MTAVIFLSLLCFVVILVSGYRLRQRGKPYGTLLLTIHKLIPLGMIAYLAFMLKQMSPLPPMIWLATILAAGCFLLLIASGGWISAAKEVPFWVKIAHKILPYLAILATGVVFVFLVIEKS